MKIPALVTVNWLSSILKTNTNNIRIIDSSWHLPTTKRQAFDEYLKKHIPMAVFFNLDHCADKNSKFDHMLPKAEDFADYVGELGIDNNTHVVAYDSSDKFAIFSSARLWWMFRAFGHGAISVLDGGLNMWCKQGLPVESGAVKVNKKVFTASLQRHLVKSFEDMHHHVTRRDVQIVDARSAGRFKGNDPEPRKDLKPGHIKGSVNLPFSEISDTSTGSVKTVPNLKNTFSAANVNLDQKIVATCGSGVTACTIALAAHLCGNENVAVYDGSWQEWFLRAPNNLKDPVSKP